MHVLYGLGAYAAAGLVVGIVFVTYGVTRVLAPPRPASIGARLILLPGAIVLWPLVLYRWMRGGAAA